MKEMITDIELEEMELKKELKSTDITLDLLNKLQKEAIEIWKEIIPLNLINLSEVLKYKMVLDNRYRMRAGRCTPDKKEISISPNCVYNHNLKNLTNIIIHEVLHSIFPDTMYHMDEWKEFANKFNKTSYSEKYGIIEQFCRLNEELQRKASKYILTCPDCGYIKYRKKKTLAMNLNIENDSEDIVDIITSYIHKGCKSFMRVSKANN